MVTAPLSKSKIAPIPTQRPPECVNLKERYGDRYRVEYEESYYAERGDGARSDDPWLMVILCQNGHICPWGGSKLAACTSGAGSVAKRLKALPFAEVAQDGADGANVVFDVEHFDQVAEIMKPRRRRRLSPEHRAKLLEASREFWFLPGSDDAGAAPESPPRRNPPTHR